MITAFSRFLSAVRSTPGSFLILRGSPSVHPLQTINAEPVLEVPASPQIGALEHPEAMVSWNTFSLCHKANR